MRMLRNPWKPIILLALMEMFRREFDVQTTILNFEDGCMHAKHMVQTRLKVTLEPVIQVFFFLITVNCFCFFLFSLFMSVKRTKLDTLETAAAI